MYLQNYSYHSWKLPESCQTWYKIKAKTQPFYSVVGYVNYLIHIYININVKKSKLEKN